ncbi:hypothetical protein [Metallibacterium scheffleri]|nr:hypothetical protein [Metallibacterium scheffleri]
MKMTENRQQLADAIANVKAAAEAEAVVRDHHNKIAAIAERETELRGQLEAAQREHSQALVQWASAGGQGDAPEAPEAVEKLAKALAAASRETDASKEAVAQHAETLAQAQAVTAQAVLLFRTARERVLADDFRVLGAEYRRRVAELLALKEHIAGTIPIVREFRDEVPNLTRVFAPVSDALGAFPVLEKGGAEYSRNAWRTYIAQLASDPAAQLAPAPTATA